MAPAPSTPSSSSTAPGTAAGAGGASPTCCTAKGHKVFTPTLTGLGERSHLMRAGINVSTHVDRRGQRDQVGAALRRGAVRPLLRRHGGVGRGRADGSTRSPRSCSSTPSCRRTATAWPTSPRRWCATILQGRGRTRRHQRAGAARGGVPGQREGPGLGGRADRPAADRHHDGKAQAHRRARADRARRPISAPAPIPIRASTRRWRG